MNAEKILIEGSLFEDAQKICQSIEKLDIKQRAVADVTAPVIAYNYFKNSPYEADIESGLHNLPVVLQDIDISDIYINGIYVDVRFCTDDTTLMVPISQFTNNILPQAYMFIKLNDSATEAEVMGFICSEDVDVFEEFQGYYKVAKKMLSGYEDIVSRFSSGGLPKEVTNAEIFAYLENSLENKKEFYKKLVLSKEARLKLIKTVKAQAVFNFVSVDTSNIGSATGSSEDITLVSDESAAVQEDLSSDNITLDDIANDNISLVVDEFEDFADVNVSDNSVSVPDEFTLEVDIADNQDKNSQESDFDFFPEELSENDSNKTTQLRTGKDFAGKISSKIDNDPFADADDPFSGMFATQNQQNSANQDSSRVVEMVDNNGEDAEQLGTLFTAGQDTEETVYSDEDFDIDKIRNKKKKSSPIALIILIPFLLAGIGTGGYFAFTNFYPKEQTAELPAPIAKQEAPNPPENPENKQNENPMPEESVDIKNDDIKEEPGKNKVSDIPASALVDSLKISWEVPAVYSSNQSVRNYLVKLGKVVQLNLKTELLLTDKVPLSDKIAVELKYNSTTNKFEVLSMIASSGEKNIDDIIMQILNKSLKMKSNIVLDSVGNDAENIILLISL